jgi:NAD(P)-dependent dehydrogenase (short-subunit alcohol dehydrogenase family)
LRFNSSKFLCSWFWIGRKYFNSKKSLKNRRILVFGPSTTLGVELIKELASREAELIVATSDPEVSEEILKNSFFESNIQVELVDFSRLQSVGEFCNRLIRKSTPIDILINESEIRDHPAKLTEDKVEITFQINYLSHFLLTVKLLPLLKRSRDARIINITTGSHKSVERLPKKEFHQLYKDTPENRKLAFEYSKLCLTSFAWKLADIIRSQNVSVHCVNPGIYSVNPVLQLITKSPNEAIQGILFAVLNDKKPGFYIEGIENSLNYNKLVSNLLLADIVWTISRKMCERSLMSMCI